MASRHEVPGVKPSYQLFMPSIYVGIAIVAGILFLTTSIAIFKEYERAVIFRLGRLIAVKGPGVVLLMPFWIDRAEKISLRTVVQDVTPQDVITKDNVSVSVNAVLSFRVLEPSKAMVEVEDYGFAVGQLAQTALRSVLGGVELDQLLSDRNRLNQDLEEALQKQSEAWGIEVMAMELKHIDLPGEMRRAMAKQAEAERERRAKMTHASGELESAESLAQAGEILGENSAALKLRFLQAMIEASTGENSTLVLPIPIDLLNSMFTKK